MWTDSKEILKSFNLNMLEKKYPEVCPVCGSPDKHVYFHKFDDEDTDGAVWIWCSKCHSYTHAHAEVPAIWKNPSFIDDDNLDDSVEYLESLKESIDEWVDNLE